MIVPYLLNGLSLTRSDMNALQNLNTVKNAIKFVENIQEILQDCHMQIKKYLMVLKNLKKSGKLFVFNEYNYILEVKEKCEYFLY